MLHVAVFPKVRHKNKKPFDIKELWAKVSKMADVATETLYNPSYITDPDWKTPHVLELEYGTCKIAWFYEIDPYTEEKNGVKKRYISFKFMKPDMTCGKLSANGVEIKRRGVYDIYGMIPNIYWH